MTTGEKPRFYLHMGMGKTGSSALQIAFILNSAALGSANVLYPSSRAAVEAARNDHVMSGNGGGIRGLLLGDSGEQEDGWAMHRKKIEETGPYHLLFSSEMLFMARKEYLLRLVRLLDELDRALWPILYLRNIAGHAVSSYGQRIKRSGATDTLLEYCEEKYQPNYRSTLTKLLDVVPETAMSVVHYDSEKQNLFVHFLHKILGAPTTTKIDDPVRRRINRSLTVGELAILRRVNKGLRGADGPRTLSDALIGGFPDLSDDKSIPREVDAVLQRRFEDEVTWVNRRFFEDSRLTVASPELAITQDNPDLVDFDPTRRLLLGMVAAVTNEHTVA